MFGRGVCAIDLDALAHNLAEVRRIVGPRVRICAVVKADAYGHGAVPVSRTLLANGADGLAVASFDEACELRRAGLAAPILVLGGVPPEAAAAAAEMSLSVVVWDEEGARRIAGALPAGRRLRVHLKVDTGMSRIGAAPSEVAALAAALRSLPFDVEGAMSHLACGEVPGHESIDRQRRTFDAALAAIAGAGLRPTLRHLANSGGLLSDPATHYDMVRPGLLLYGGLPGPLLAGRVRLRPVMQLRSRIVQVRDLPAGTGVGYGLTFTAARPSRIAVLPIGYGQGYPRSLSNRGHAVVRDRLVPVVGIVSMDHCTLDVTDVPDAATGDEVVLWGRDVEPRLDVMDVGADAGTLGYEILTRVGRQIPRLYGEGESRLKKAAGKRG